MTYAHTLIYTRILHMNHTLLSLHRQTARYFRLKGKRSGVIFLLNFYITYFTFTTPPHAMLSKDHEVEIYIKLLKKWQNRKCRNAENWWRVWKVSIERKMMIGNWDLGIKSYFPFPDSVFPLRRDFWKYAPVFGISAFPILYIPPFYYLSFFRRSSNNKEISLF
jgi:hypothetical protein